MSKHTEQDQICIAPELGSLLMQFELGRLSSEDRTRFERHLLDCDFCLTEAIAMRETANALVANREEIVADYEIAGVTINSLLETDADKPKLQPLQDSSQPSNAQIKKRTSVLSWDTLFSPKVGLAFASAAVFLIMFGLGVFDKPQPADIGEFAPPAWLAWQSRNTSDGDSLLKIAQSRYAVHDYAGAVPLLEQYLDTSENSQVALYLGVSYYKLKEYKKADSALLRITTTNSVILEEAQFYQALVLVQNGENERAMKVLDRMVSDRSTRADDAQNIITTLRKHSE